MPDPNTFEGDLLVHGADGIETLPATGTTSTRGIGVVELARAIRAGVPERASGEQAFHVLDVMVATIEAGESGAPIEVASTLQVAPALPEDWDPRASTLV